MRRLKIAAALMLCLICAGGALAEEARFALVGEEGAALRSAPSFDAEVAAFCPALTWLTLLQEEEGWCRARNEAGVEGWLPSSMAQEAAVRTAWVGTVTGMAENASLNLREEPSYQARVLGVYYNGMLCEIHARDNGWARVTVDGQTGYFREEFLTIKELPCSDRVATTHTANGNAAALRAGPGETFPIIRRLAEGSCVMLLNSGAAWAQVGVGETVGFVRTESLLSDAPPSPAALLSDAGAPYAIVRNPKSTQVLNLRENPDTGSRSLAQFANGAKVWVREMGEEWCEVLTLGGQRGYMMTAYLQLYGLPDVPEKQVSHPQQTYVNLRALPSVTLGQVLAELPHGERVTVLAPGDLWYKVRYQGQTGYVASEFLQNVE